MCFIAKVHWVSSVDLRLVCVPSELQPAHPMSSLNSVFDGIQAKAVLQAWQVRGQLLSRLGDGKVRGFLCLGDP